MSYNDLGFPLGSLQRMNPSGYSTPYQYICDPIGRKAAQVWQARQPSSLDPYNYSSPQKVFYPVVPYNTQSSPYSPIRRFDITRLPQTNILDLINLPHSIPLSETILPLCNKMGTMGSPGKSFGTCTLIAANLVLVARHAIEGYNIQNITVTFGYTKWNGSFFSASHCKLHRVIEESSLCDYAIVQLEKPLGKQLGYVPLDTKTNIISEPALLHYPLGKTLQVSVHTFVQTQYQAVKHLSVYHDSDYLSSGGAYFNPLGQMVALHLGAELRENTMNLGRYALPLQEIVRHHPYSILRKFSEGQLSQESSYACNTPLTYLPFTPHSYLIDEEGRLSEKVLRGLLQEQNIQDGEICYTKSGTISFSNKNLNYIASKYSDIYKEFKKQCLGRVEIHSVTKQYSVTGVIESDHIIPYEVWKRTTYPKMKKLTEEGTGKRPGENSMPAITIPYEKHRDLRTTGSSEAAKEFRQALVRLCNQGQVGQALTKCLEEYKSHKIASPPEQSLLFQFRKLGLIENS